MRYFPIICLPLFASLALTGCVQSASPKQQLPETTRAELKPDMYFQRDVGRLQVMEYGTIVNATPVDIIIPAAKDDAGKVTPESTERGMDYVILARSGKLFSLTQPEASPRFKRGDKVVFQVNGSYQRLMEDTLPKKARRNEGINWQQ